MINYLKSSYVWQSYFQPREFAFSDEKIEGLIKNLRVQFESLEKEERPAAGYCVTIHTDNMSLKGNVTPSLQKRDRRTLLVSVEDASSKCSFCSPAKDRVVQIFDKTIAIRSLSDQILVVPKKHYVHLFDVPDDLQKELFRNMLSLRFKYKETRSPIEFHCGRAGGQTVFHVHGRTGIRLP